MQKNSILIHEVTPEQLTSLFEGIQQQLSEIKSNLAPKAPDVYMTRGDVAQMLKCDLSTVHNWTVKGKLIPYGIGNRVYYKRSEVEAALVAFGKNTGGNDD